jgi:protein involved in polysaccharide export with SLBB domain
MIASVLLAVPVVVFIALASPPIRAQTTAPPRAKSSAEFSDPITPAARTNSVAAKPALSVTRTNLGPPTAGLRTNALSAPSPSRTNAVSAPSPASKNAFDNKTILAAKPAPSVTTTNSGSSATVVAATNAPSMDALDEKHILAIGDKLSFRIVEDEDEPKPLVVTDSGDLDLGQFGRFPAQKKTCKQLAREIKTSLEKEYYYQATVLIAVDLMTKSRGKVYLAGAVRLPGAQDLPSDEVLTLSKAILRAGGFTDYADKAHVKITRKNETGAYEKRFTVDVSLILEKGKSDKDEALESDDMIYIPDRSIRL